MKRIEPTDLEGRTFDLVVIGGGITGAAVARDAALRGLSVVMLERDDFASGTSSRSGRLVHGGMRYLGNLQLALVRQALREREHMLRLAPNLCLPRPFLLLVYRGYQESLWKLRLGLKFYDTWARTPPDRRHRILHARDVLEAEPHVLRTDLDGAGVFYDFMTDDASLTLAMVRSAVEAGAVVINHAAVTGFRIAGDRVVGVHVQDGLSEAQSTILGRQIVVAAGPWADEVARLEPDGHERPPMLRPPKGAHLVFRASDVPISHPLFFRFPRDRRLVWAIPTPTGEDVYVGGTDTDYDGPLDEVVADHADVEFLLGVVNHILPDARVDGSHIIGSWAGLRPLARPDRSLPASAVSREHRIVRSRTGVLYVTGGKLTTARLMGEEAVDAALEGLGRSSRDVPSHSLDRPASQGGVDAASVDGSAHRAAALGLSERQWQRLAFRHGTGADRILDLVAADGRLAQSVAGSEAILAEVRHAADEEMAMTLDDVMARRLGITPWVRDGGLSQIDDVVDVLSDRLHWDDARARSEVARYRRTVEMNRSFATAPASDGGGDA